MNELPSFFRTNTETLALQCFRHMEKAGLASDRSKKRCLATASDLADALVDSIEATDPTIFSGRLEPYLKKGMGRSTSSHLLHIMAFLEKTAMEHSPDGAQSRLLWAIFHNARTATINTISKNIKKQQDIAGKPDKKTISALKMEIEERKQTEETLRESERKFRDIAELSPQVIFEQKADGTITFANKQGMELFGYTEEDLQKGIAAIDLFPEFEHNRVRENIEKIITGERGTAGYEYTVRKKDGTTFSAIIYTTRILKNDRFTGFRGVLVDITRVKETEERLRERERRFRDLAELMPQVIFEMDTAGTITFANKQAFEIFGYDETDLADGINAFSLFPAKELPRLMTNLQKISEGNRSTGNEYTVLKKDGSSFPVIIHITRIIQEGLLAGYRGIIIDITEQKRVQRKIAESEKMYRTFFDSTTDFVFLKDEKLRYILANKVLLDFFGKKEHEVLGSTDYALMPLEAASNCHQTDLRAIETNAVSVNKEAIGDRIFETLKFPVDIAKGKTGIGGFIRDITERTKAEEALKKSEERFRKYFEVPLVGVTIVSPDGKWLEVNDKFCQMVGYSREELLGMNWQELTPREYLADETADRNAFLAGQRETINTREKRYRKKDGAFVDAILSVHCVRKNNGSPDYFMAVIQDITERKAFERKIIESEQALRATLSASPIGIARVRGRAFEWVNEAMHGITGYGIDELAGRSVRFLYETDDEFSRIGEHLYRKGQAQTRWVRKDGGIRHILLQVSPTHDNAHIVTASDITERNQLESQLIHSQKMEAVGTLAGGIAHDFNNLLSAIMGYASLIQMKMDAGDPSLSYVSQILVSSEKAANLTQSLLAFSRKQVINPTPLVINDTAEKLHRLLRRLIPEDVEFRIDNAPEKLIILGDTGQIDQVIMNLVTNARDSMPHGGKIGIGIKRATIDSNFVTAHGYGTPGEYALITVSDTGYGIDEKTAEKIFEPFFTTKEVGKGTGLGLSIVYGIVKQHNGFISVASQQGKGSTFSVYLPLVWLEPANEAVHEEIVGGSETILIAEDNNELRALSVNVLENNGYTVIAARDGSEAVEAFREHRSDISLAILDVVMPKMNGKEAFETIKKLDPSVKVLFTSGYTDDIIEEKGMANERYDFLGKPITPGVLLKKIREVLDKK